MADQTQTSLDRQLTAAMMCLAAALQIGVTIWRFDQLTIDRDAYLGIAANLLEGHGFCTPGTTTPTAYRPPLYPLILAAAMSIMPAAWAVAAVNVAAGLITVWLVMQLGDRLGLGRWRFAAGLMIAGNPLLLNAMPQPMTEVVFTALTTAWWWAVMKLVDPKSPRLWPLLVGVLFGLAALCRPTIWPLAGLMGLAWIVPPVIDRGLRLLSSPLAPAPGERARERGRALQTAAILALGALLVVTPWMIRNQLAFGHSILTTTHGGYTLLLANNPVHDAEVVQQPWGAVWSGESLERWQRKLKGRTGMYYEISPNADELTKDQWMSNRAMEYIRIHPDRFFAAVWHRVRSLWAILPRGEGTNLPSALRGSIAAFFACEFFIAIIGTWTIFRRGEWPVWLPGLLLIVTVQAVHLVYWTDTRMRTPLEPVLALLAARACCMLFARGKEAQG